MIEREELYPVNILFSDMSISKQASRQKKKSSNYLVELLIY